MSRSGYSDWIDNWELIKWRGQVASATGGKRGQKFFRDLVASLDSMPVKRLISGDLETAEGEVCALGSLARARGVTTLGRYDTYDHGKLGETFDIAHQLAQEVMWVNDEAGPYRGETPEERWTRVRKWAASQIQVTNAELEPLP